MRDRIENKARILVDVRRSAAAAVVLLFLGASISVAQPDLMMDTLARDITVEQRLDSLVDLSMTFIDERGDRVTLAKYFGDGKPVILTMVYYGCPMLCGMILEGTTKSIKQVPLEIGEDYRVVSVSFDTTESHELAAKKKRTFERRMKRDGTEEGWAFLTSDGPEVRKLADQVGFKYFYDEKSRQFAHSAAIIVLTPTGRVSKYFFGIEYDPTDVRLGLVDASEESIGTLADQVLLLCFQYDPMTGTYGFGVKTATIILGVLTFVGIVGFIWHSTRTDRQRAAGEARQRGAPVST